jgi:hypothetical protein
MNKESEKSRDGFDAEQYRKYHALQFVLPFASTATRIAEHAFRTRFANSVLLYQGRMNIQQRGKHLSDKATICVNNVLIQWWDAVCS